MHPLGGWSILGSKTQTLRPAIDERGLAMSGMQDDKKLLDDLGTAHEVILVSVGHVGETKRKDRRAQLHTGQEVDPIPCCE